MIFLLIASLILVASSTIENLNWSFCENKYHGKRTFFGSTKLREVDKSEIQILGVSSNKVKFKRGEELVFNIKAKLLKGRLQYPKITVKVYQEGTTTGDPFLKYTYNICTYLTLGCPINEGEEREITITKKIPTAIPKSMLQEPFTIIIEMQDNGVPIECILFQIKIDP